MRIEARLAAIRSRLCQLELNWRFSSVQGDKFSLRWMRQQFAGWVARKLHLVDAEVALNCLTKGAFEPTFVQRLVARFKAERDRARAEWERLNAALKKVELALLGV